jgi:uncharacterized coiled-coil protein SlyX
MAEESSNILEFKRVKDRANEERSLEPAAPNDLPLRGGGGGGTFDGMEGRIARLEADVSHIKTDLGEIKGSLGALNTHVSEARVNIATLTERMGHLPTKAYIGVAVTACAAAAITGLTLLSRFGWLVAGVPTH